MFNDRRDAAQRLAETLGAYRRRPGAVVLSIPRGGVPVGGVIARRLGLPLDVIAVRKIGHPDNHECSIGALSLTGADVDAAAAARLGVTPEYLAAEIERVRGILRRRHELYRLSMNPLELKGKVVILVDDRAVTGRTLRTAIELLRRQGVLRVTAAVPIAPEQTVRALRGWADEVFCPATPAELGSIGQFYKSLPEVSDEEVIGILRDTAAVA
jgi:predicted phosphoribosyltransferase